MMATVLTRLMPATPSRFIGRSAAKQTETANSTAIMENSGLGLDSAEDAEGGRGEEEISDVAAEGDGDQEDAQDYIDENQNGGPSTASALSDENNEEQEFVTPRTKRKTKARKGGESRKRRRIVKADKDESAGEDTGGQSSDASTSPEPEWEAEEGEEEQDEAEVVEGNRCTFCKQLEDEDPSEEFELILTCVVCKENAHRQCARDAYALLSEEDADNWRCPNCIDNEADPDERGREQKRRASSAPKIARDLLPAQRAVKVGSHSVFNTLILDDDPMDGSRSLRKRKTSNEAEAHSSGQKSHRRGSSEVLVIENDAKISPGDNIQGRAATPQEKTAPATEITPRSRSGRLRQQRKPEKPLVSIIEKNDYRFVLSINLGSPKISRLLEALKRKNRRARNQARHERQVQAPPDVSFLEVSHYPAIQSASFTAPFSAFHSRDGDETKSKPYGGILTEAEADNSKTFPQTLDRKKFENARLKAEDEWRRKLLAATAEQARTSQKIVPGPPTRIKCINFGRYEIDTWHSAPYPEEYSRNRVLYICEFCLKYMNSDFVAWRHKLKCPARHPPGDEIYHDGAFSFFEVDGRKNPVYCQNLCLLAKLFLGSKTLYYDVEPFLFYVMTENNDEGCHFVGYFSKEKRPSSQNNVSCILVLPIHQRRGFGHMLIEFSYLLTRVEGKTGSPEKPLSDMGLVSYRNYWRRVLCSYLLGQKEALSITDISDETGMTADDIVCGLEALRALVRDPVTKTYGLRLDYPYYKQYIEGYEKKGYTKINPDALTWVPYVMGRDNSHYENAPHIQTVAQRGDDTGISLMPEEGIQLAINGASEQDFSGSKSGGSIADIPTPMEEVDQHLHEAGPTPFPWLESNPSRQASPAKPVQIATDPSTPFANGDWSADSPIPPTRFEVFPPLPGSTARKRAVRGRPRVPSRRGTPLRHRSPLEDTPQTAIRPSTMRRGRSKLAGKAEEPSEDADLIRGETHEDMVFLTRATSKSQDDAEGSPEANGEQVATIV